MFWLKMPVLQGFNEDGGSSEMAARVFNWLAGAFIEIAGSSVELAGSFMGCLQGFNACRWSFIDS
jgi:hypothetical protein